MTPDDIDLTGAWMGWRIRGNLLISPYRDRLTVGRLVGIVTMEHHRQACSAPEVRRKLVSAQVIDFRNRVQRLRGDGTKQNLSVRLESPSPTSEG